MKILINKIESITLMVISMLIIFYSYKYHILVDGFISSGLFPFIVGILIFIFSSLLVLNKNSGLKDNSKNDMVINYRDVINTILIIFVSILFFYFLIERLNFFILGTLYMTFIILLLGEKNVFYVILFPVISNVLIYIVFSILLKVF